MLAEIFPGIMEQRSGINFLNELRRGQQGSQQGGMPMLGMQGQGVIPNQPGQPSMMQPGMQPQGQPAQQGAIPGLSFLDQLAIGAPKSVQGILSNASAAEKAQGFRAAESEENRKFRAEETEKARQAKVEENVRKELEKKEVKSTENQQQVNLAAKKDYEKAVSIADGAKEFLTYIDQAEELLKKYPDYFGTAKGTVASKLKPGFGGGVAKDIKSVFDNLTIEKLSNMTGIKSVAVHNTIGEAKPGIDKSVQVNKKGLNILRKIVDNKIKVPIYFDQVLKKNKGNYPIDYENEVRSMRIPKALQERWTPEEYFKENGEDPVEYRGHTYAVDEDTMTWERVL
jgi:hypothetical protein